MLLRILTFFKWVYGNPLAFLVGIRRIPAYHVDYTTVYIYIYSVKDTGWSTAENLRAAPRGQSSPNHTQKHRLNHKHFTVYVKTLLYVFLIMTLDSLEFIIVNCQ